MIGDARAKGKAGKAQAFTAKNSQGRSHKINIPSVSDGGGDFQQKPTAKRMDKHNARPGTGSRDRQNPAEQRHKKSLKAVPEGSLIDQWCMGRRSDYK